MTLTLDITGSKNIDLNIPLPAKTKKKLEGQDIPAPEAVTLHLEEASLSERKRYSQKEALARAQANTEGFLAELIMLRAAEGTDERVVRAMVDDMTATAAAQITHACMHGELPNAEGAKKP
ncbi:hypothetical protein DEIPH_ctg041orf0012 [Deinococcus phoenicis]|uniref:Uncharacterized protein n=1 Tax=Deinococcus phoenicis TaxID=1476583 RepID=A0A016QN41_9DEIO|nr:hypothetical protein [Deinococcus phoenicis]EYB67416.1 hypothetical protein DEIPH_ctg041orf0012 [Deinococcus phoenicis]